MKIRFIFIFSLIVSSQAAQTQSIKNADFESGNLSPWIFSNPATYNPSMQPGYTVAVEKNITGHNSSAAHIKSAGGSKWCPLKQVLHYQPTDSLERLRVSVDLKVNSSGTVSTGISARALQGRRSFGLFSNYVTANQDWTRINVDFIVTRQTDSIALFCVVKGDGEVWFDNVTIEKISTGKIEQSEEAKRYLDTAVSIIAQNALFKDSVDFKVLIQYANVIAADAKSTADCYGAIQYILEGLEDGHSFFQTPEQATFLNRQEDTSMLLPTGKKIGNIGYLKVPACMAINAAMEKKYADSLQHIIQSVDNKNITGWIVDDRDNTGGNCWPMLLGLGPVLGEGIFEKKIQNVESPDSIGYWNGVIKNKDSIIIKTSTPYTLKKPFPKVALLMNGMSASSGESVILGFRFRPKTRLFGEASYGLTTGNRDFTLSDGAMMFVCAAKATDRLGNVYGGKIHPDVELKDDPSTPNDEVIDAAIN